jgi:hypothetical protein
MEWNFGEILLTMLALYFWFMVIWMFMGVFADIFRRRELSGVAKAGWLALIVLLPFFGVLIYMISRPPMTDADVQMMEARSGRRGASAPYSVADEVGKLQGLRSAGTITEEEFGRLKTQAMAS